MINQWKIPEKGGVGKSVPEKCKSPLTFTLKIAFWQLQKVSLLKNELVFVA